ncbi:MAG: HPF/RaiA family ribosome-associated protein [Limisphaerales bacterium]
MILNWDLMTKGMRPQAQLQGKLEQKIAKLATYLKHFPSDAVHLQVTLQRHPKRVRFTAALTLRLPSNVLESKKSGPDPLPAFDQAIKALLREVAVLKSALRHKNDWEQVARRKL